VLAEGVDGAGQRRRWAVEQAGREEASHVPEQSRRRRRGGPGGFRRCGRALGRTRTQAGGGQDRGDPSRAVASGDQALSAVDEPEPSEDEEDEEDDDSEEEPDVEESPEVSDVLAVVLVLAPLDA
jgi:hypothetical protein